MKKKNPPISAAVNNTINKISPAINAAKGILKRSKLVQKAKEKRSKKFYRVKRALH